MKLKVAFRTLPFATLLLATAAAQAQTSAPFDRFPAYFAKDPPSVTQVESYRTKYVRALLGEVVNQIEKTASPSCLKERQLDREALLKGVTIIFFTYGGKMIQALQTNYDEQAFEQAAGESVREIAELKKNEKVARLDALEFTANYHHLADWILSNFDQHLLLREVKLPVISPDVTGNEALLKLQDEPSAEIGALRKDPSPEIKRYVDLQASVIAASGKSFNLQKAMQWTPSTFYDGVENDLSKLCVAIK